MLCNSENRGCDLENEVIDSAYGGIGNMHSYRLLPPLIELFQSEKHANSELTMLETFNNIPEAVEQSSARNQKDVPSLHELENSV